MLQEPYINNGILFYLNYIFSYYNNGRALRLGFSCTIFYDAIRMILPSCTNYYDFHETGLELKSSMKEHHKLEQY